jgi:hypothetical protein
MIWGRERIDDVGIVAVLASDIDRHLEHVVTRRGDVAGNDIVAARCRLRSNRCCAATAGCRPFIG